MSGGNCGQRLFSTRPNHVSTAPRTPPHPVPLRFRGASYPAGAGDEGGTGRWAVRDTLASFWGEMSVSCADACMGAQY